MSKRDTHPHQLDLDLYDHVLRSEMYAVTVGAGTRPLLVGNNRKKLFEQILKPNKIEYSNGRRWIELKTVSSFYRSLAHEETKYRSNGKVPVRIERIPAI